jgi:hypothetical protein
MRTFGVALTLATVAVSLAGCGPSAREDAAGSAAERFAGTLREEDGGAACGMLTPATRRELEDSSGTACAEAIVEEDLPQLGAPAEVKVYGHHAEVRGDGDTLFLADHSGQWLVVAAGCEPRGDLPYDCAVKGP